MPFVDGISNAFIENDVRIVKGTLNEISKMLSSRMINDIGFAMCSPAFCTSLPDD